MLELFIYITQPTFPLPGNHHSNDHPFFPILVFFLYFFPLQGQSGGGRGQHLLSKKSLMRHNIEAPHPNVHKNPKLVTENGEV